MSSQATMRSEGPRLLSLQQPTGLRASRRKWQFFAAESYFQEVFAEVESRGVCWALRELDACSFVLFKPDAGARRCVDDVLRLLRVREIVPVATFSVPMDRLAVRELWRYELNIAAYARYPAIDALLTLAPSLLVLLRRPDNQRAERSLSAEIRRLKGPSAIERRVPGELRYEIRALDGMLNHIHSPDDSIDVLREIGVLFGRRDRRAVLDALLNESTSMRPAELRAAIDEFYRRLPPHTLRLEDVLSTLAAQGLAAPNELARLGRESLDFDDFVHTVKAWGANLSVWDCVVLFVAGRECSVPGVQRLLNPDDDRGADDVA